MSTPSTSSSTLADLLGQLCGSSLLEQALISKAHRLASQNDDAATEAIGCLATLVKHEHRQVRTDAGRVWARMLSNCTDAFFKAATTDTLLADLKSLLDGPLTPRQKQLLVGDIGQAMKSLTPEQTPSSLRRFWGNVQLTYDLNLAPGYSFPNESSPSNSPISPASASSNPSGPFHPFYGYSPTEPTFSVPPVNRARRRVASSGVQDRPSMEPTNKFVNPERQRQQPVNVSRPSPRNSAPAPVAPLPMMVEWTSPTTSGYAPEPQWINFNTGSNGNQQMRDLSMPQWPSPPFPSPPQRQAPFYAGITQLSKPTPSVTATSASAMSSHFPDLSATLRSLRELPGRLTLPIQDFYTHVQLKSNIRNGGELRISNLFRGRELGSNLHEFLVFSIFISPSSFVWGRLDRRPVAKDSFLLSSPTTASDMIEFSSSKDTVLPPDTQISAMSSLNRHASLRDLATILSVVEEEAPEYRLLKENCRFFASVIEDSLVSSFDGMYSHGQEGHADLAPEIRQKIRGRVREKLQT